MSGLWYVLVYGYDSFEDVTLEVNYAPVYEVLQYAFGESLFLSLPQGEAFYISMEMPEGVAHAYFTTTNGTGDPDLYIKYGDIPVFSSWDYRSFLDGTEEAVGIDHPEPGTWYAMVYAYEAFQGVLFTAFLDMETVGFTFAAWADSMDLDESAAGVTDRNGPLNLSNLEAYAMGINPSQATMEQLPRIALDPDNPHLIPFYYQLDTRAEGISVQMLSSVDMVQWQEATPVSDTVLSIDNDIAAHRALFQAPENGPIFIRFVFQADP